MKGVRLAVFCVLLPVATACGLNPFGSSDDAVSGGPSSSSTDDGGISNGRRDGGSSRDGGASSSRDAGPKGDGGAGTTRADGGTGGGGVQCEALQTCCDTLDSDMYSGCMSIVSSGYASSCESALSSYTSGGYCTGGIACNTLASCCSTLPPGPGWADTCNQEVALNNDPECTSLYGTYQTDGYCKGNPGGLSDNCYALSSCCDQLADPDYTTCNGYVSGNVDGTCQSALASYKAQSLCE